MAVPRIAYVNVHVRDLDRSVAFFAETLGLPVKLHHAEFGYASLEAGPVTLGLAHVAGEGEGADLPGHHTGIGFAVPDLRAAHATLAAKGVRFPMEPEKQPWGGFMALFEDPDGNVFYLDELPDPD